MMSFKVVACIFLVVLFVLFVHVVLVSSSSETLLAVLLHMYWF